jgi:Brp/Blh family beta-carotene 15,15'-monooxygenase
MKNYIKKINLYHSFLFFLFTNLFVIIIDQNKDLNISTIICLILILTIGVSHGSLDHIKGKKLFKILGISNIYIFYISYIFISLAIIFTWLLIPTFTLFVFLAVAAYHFGKEDTLFLINKDFSFKEPLFFLKGLLIIIAPLNFHFVETINIFKMLFVESERFYFYLDLIEQTKIISLTFILSTLASIYLFSQNFKIINISIFLDFFSILMLNYYLPPLLAFTVYFCFLHSIRHAISLIIHLNQINFKIGFLLFVKKALPLTILTIIICLITLFFLSNYYVLDNAIIKIIFIGLASLTFPHILLEYLLEKNEK